MKIWKNMKKAFFWKYSVWCRQQLLPDQINPNPTFMNKWNVWSSSFYHRMTSESKFSRLGNERFQPEQGIPLVASHFQSYGNAIEFLAPGRKRNETTRHGELKAGIRRKASFRPPFAVIRIYGAPSNGISCFVFIDALLSTFRVPATLRDKYILIYFSRSDNKMCSTRCKRG